MHASQKRRARHHLVFFLLAFLPFSPPPQRTRTSSLTEAIFEDEYSADSPASGQARSGQDAPFFLPA